MTDAQKVALRAVNARKELRSLALDDDATAEAIQTATAKVNDLEAREAVLVAADEAEHGKAKVLPNDAEGREIRQLQGKVRVGSYLSAAADGVPLSGAEAEYNQALKHGRGAFPLRLLAPAREARATTDGEGAAMQGDWIDRLFAVSSAMRVGVSMRSVPQGVATYPVTTAGATGEQQDRSEATADAAWTVSVTEMKPKRASVRAVFNVEDQARLPGLEDSLRRDLSMALMDSIDAVIFKGDSGPTTAAYDIAGLQTEAGIEKTLTQAQKILGINVLQSFVELCDGKHAESLADLGVVASVGSNVLWHSTYTNSAADSLTVAQFLMKSGLSWGVRADIDTNTAADDFGAYVGRKRGIDGAGICAIWESGTLVRDIYSRASQGEVAITMNYLHDVQFPRASNFARVKYVA